MRPAPYWLPALLLALASTVLPLEAAWTVYDPTFQIPGYFPPTIAVDNCRMPHMVFDGYSADVTYVRLSETGWVSELGPKNCCGGESFPLVLDHLGRPHVVFVVFVESDPTGFARKLMYAARSSDGSWSSEIIETGAVDKVLDPANLALALDSHDRPHIAYTLYDTAVPTTNLKYATKLGSTWLTEVVEKGGRIGTGFSSSMAIDSSDQPHIAYGSGDGGDFFFESKGITGWTDDNGQPCYAEHPSARIVTCGEAVNTSIAVARNGTVHIGWSSRFDALYSSGSIGSWTTSVMEPGGAAAALGLDPNDQPRIAYVAPGHQLKYG